VWEARWYVEDFTSLAKDLALFDVFEGINSQWITPLIEKMYISIILTFELYSVSETCSVSTGDFGVLFQGYTEKPMFHYQSLLSFLAKRWASSKHLSVRSEQFFYRVFDKNTVPVKHLTVTTNFESQRLFHAQLPKHVVLSNMRKLILIFSC
jgi:hypothetical protein